MTRNQRTAGADGEIDIGYIAVALWKAKYKLLLSALVVGVIMLGIMQLVDRKYRASAQVLVAASDNVFTRPGDERGRSNEQTIIDEAGVKSQVQMLGSIDLLRRVVAKIGDGPQSAPTDDGGLVSQLSDMLNTVTRLFNAAPSINPDYDRTAVFADGLDVYEVSGSRVITIDYSSSDPTFAADAANTVISEYLALQGEEKERRTREAVVWLENEIARLRETVAASESRVADFRAEAGLQTGQNNTPLNREQLTSLNSELARARGVQLDADAKAMQIQELLDGGGSLDTSREVINSQLILRFREQKGQLRARLAQLSASLLPGHPTIKAIQSQIADLDQEIRSEAQNLKRALENDATVAKNRVESLEAKLGQLQKVSANADSQSVKLRELEREATSNRDLLETFLKRYREALARQNVDAFLPDARIISNASVPSKPYFPKIPLFLIASVLVVLILGVLGITLKALLSGNAIVYATPELDSPSPSLVPDSMSANITEKAPGTLSDHRQDLPKQTPLKTAQRVAAPEPESKQATRVRQPGIDEDMLRLRNSIEDVLQDERIKAARPKPLDKAVSVVQSTGDQPSDTPRTSVVADPASIRDREMSTAKQDDVTAEIKKTAGTDGSQVVNQMSPSQETSDASDMPGTGVSDFIPSASIHAFKAAHIEINPETASSASATDQGIVTALPERQNLADLLIFLQLAPHGESLAKSMRLAENLCKQKQDVLLIDVDLANIGVSDTGEGFWDTVNANASLELLVATDPDHGLNAVAAGHKGGDWEQSADVIRTLFRNVRGDYDYVVVNLGGPDHLDAALEVIGEGADVVIVPDADLGEDDVENLREALEAFSCRDVTVAAANGPVTRLEMPAE